MKSVGNSCIFVVINYTATSHSSRRCPQWVMTLVLGQYGSVCWVLFSEGLHIEASFSKRQTIYEARGVWGFCSGLSPVKISPNSCLPTSHNACENSLLSGDWDLVSTFLLFLSEIWTQMLLLSYFLTPVLWVSYRSDPFSSPAWMQRTFGGGTPPCPELMASNNVRPPAACHQNISIL